MPAPDSTTDCSVTGAFRRAEPLVLAEEVEVRLGDGDLGLRAQRLVGGEEQGELVFERDRERVDRAG